MNRTARVTVALVALLSSGLAFAAPPGQKKGAAPAEQKKEAAPAPPAGPPMPNAFKLNMLIRTTVIALNQANATGNYSVLRDLAAPGFRESNNLARLAEIFASLRGRNLDLSPIVFIDPKLFREPAILENGLLRLTGFFPSRPEQVNFDMMFQFVGGDWRLFGVAVDTRMVVDAPAAAAAPAPPDPNAQAPLAMTQPPPKTESAPPVRSSPVDGKSSTQPTPAPETKGVPAASGDQRKQPVATKAKPAPPPTPKTDNPALPKTGLTAPPPNAPLPPPSENKDANASPAPAETKTSEEDANSTISKAFGSR